MSAVALRRGRKHEGPSLDLNATVGADVMQAQLLAFVECMPKRYTRKDGTTPMTKNLQVLDKARVTERLRKVLDARRAKAAAAIV